MPQSKEIDPYAEIDERAEAEEKRETPVRVQAQKRNMDGNNKPQALFPVDRRRPRSPF